MSMSHDEKGQRRNQRLIEIDRQARNARKKDERAWKKHGKQARLTVAAAILRRGRLRKKYRKALDFILGRRPPMPWYHANRTYQPPFKRISGHLAIPIGMAVEQQPLKSQKAEHRMLPIIKGAIAEALKTL